MSGRKCSDVTISENAYNQLLNNASRADDARRTAERRANEERQRNRELHRNFERRQQEMQAEYRSGLNALSSDIRDVERQQHRRLEEIRRQASENRRKAAADLANLGRAVSRRIEEQGARFQQALRDQGATFQRALREHRAEVTGQLRGLQEDIQQDRTRQHKAAEAQIDDLEKLFRLMGSQRTHERFAPGELDELESRFSLCRANLDSGNSQAALATAQERYFEYQQLQFRIAERQAEWEAYLVEVQRLAAETSGAIAAAENATYTFSEGDSSQGVEAQVDYWTEGALTAFRDRLSGHLERLRAPEELPTDTLKQMLDELGPMDAELAALVARAKERLVQSQVRQNLAASILASFEGTDWELDDSTYENEDFRMGLHLKLRNSSNEEIVASVTPVPDQDGGTRANVEINFFDRYNDEQLRQARLKEMNDRMQTEGVHAGSFECLDQSHGRPGAEQMRDFKRLRAPLREPVSPS